MQISDVLAAIALIVSIASAWLSYKAHRESARRTERETGRDFSRERSEFLIRIERSTKLFERVKAHIEALLGRIEREPAQVQSSLIDVVKRLNADLDYLQGCLRQSRALWDENYDMNQDGFAHHKPRHLALLEDDEKYAIEAMDRAAKAEESINMSSFLSNPVIG